MKELKYEFSYVGGASAAHAHGGAESASGGGLAPPEYGALALGRRRSPISRAVGARSTHRAARLTQVLLPIGGLAFATSGWNRGLCRDTPFLEIFWYWLSAKFSTKSRFFVTKLISQSDKARRAESKTYTHLPSRVRLEFSRNSQSPKNGCFRLKHYRIGALPTPCTEPLNSSKWSWEVFPLPMIWVEPQFDSYLRRNQPFLKKDFSDFENF